MGKIGKWSLLWRSLPIQKLKNGKKDGEQMAKSVAYVLVGSLKYVCSPLLRIQGELLETMLSIVVPQGLVFLFPQSVLSALKSLSNMKGLGS